MALGQAYPTLFCVNCVILQFFSFKVILKSALKLNFLLGQKCPINFFDSLGTFTSGFVVQNQQFQRWNTSIFTLKFNLTNFSIQEI